MSTVKKFAGQTIIYGVSTIFSRLLNSILTPIFTRTYPPGPYGILTNLFSWAAIINAILSFGMETTFFRYLNKHQDEKEQVYSNTFFTIAALSGLFLASTLLFSHEIAAFLQEGSGVSDYVSYVRYFIWILVTDALAVIPFAKIRAEGRPFRYSLIKLLNIVTVVSLNLAFIYLVPAIIKHNWIGASFLSSWYRPGWIGYVFISNLAASVITLLLLVPEIARVKLMFSRAMIMNMFSYSFPVLIANLSFIINEHIDKMMMPKLLPAERFQDLGIYGACCKISIFLSIFITAFRLGAEPFFFTHAKNKNSGETYSRIMDYFVIVVCLIYVGIVANIEILKLFISGKNELQTQLYWSGLPVVPILLFGYVSLGVYVNLSIWYKLSDQTKYGLYISGIGAVLTVVLNLIFIPR